MRRISPRDLILYLLVIMMMLAAVSGLIWGIVIGLLI